MKLQKMVFMGLWLLVALWALLQETDVLRHGFLQLGAEGEYVANLLCFVTAVGGTYFACRLFAFRCVRRELFPDDGGVDFAAYRRWNNRRLMLLAVAILPSAFLYYAGSFSQTALYCALLALAGSLLCWPSETIEEK